MHRPTTLPTSINDTSFGSEKCAKLSTILETNQSVEKDGEEHRGDVDPSGTHVGSFAGDEMEFEVDEKDDMLRGIENIAIKLDIHKNGILFLRQLVYFNK